MENFKCPHCGSPQINQIGPNQYNCPYCGQTFYMNNNIHQQRPNNPNINIPAKNRTVAAILAIILGDIGAHCFYMGHYVKGIIYLLFFWTYIPAIIGLIEGIIYLTKTDEEFAMKCN